ncbi:unnamed protein product [Malus baccata var. baccata]
MFPGDEEILHPLVPVYKVLYLHLVHKVLEKMTMARHGHGALRFYHAFPILLLNLSLFCTVYIVYLGSLSGRVYSTLLSQHLNILERVVQGSNSAESLLVRSFNGFAAYLTDQEREKLASDMTLKYISILVASLINDTNSSILDGEFAFGSGHINPVKAIDPGLVYEASKEDYMKLLCTRYDESTVRLISGDNSSCPTGPEKGSPVVVELIYPSMGAEVAAMEPFTVKFHRRVKNVGLANSTYNAKISPNAKVDIKVAPEVLSFKSLNEEQSFDVTVVGSSSQFESRVSAALVWSDGTHTVRSPIVVYTVPRA